MKYHKTFLFILPLILLLTITTSAQFISLANDSFYSELKNPGIPIKQKNSGANWTVMIYMDGDNDLEDYAILDYEEFLTPGKDSNENVSITIFFDRSSGYSTSYGDWTGAYYFYVNNTESPIPANAEKSLGEVNMADPQTLIDFVNWSVIEYPATNYALILWNHGNGLRGVCWDDSPFSNDRLSLEELSAGLGVIRDDILFGKKLDILGFDTCLSGTLGVLYECKDFVDYIVCSQENVNAYGYSYAAFIEHARMNGSISPIDFAIAIANETIEYYYSIYGINCDQTQSVIDTSQLDMLVSSINTFSDYMVLNQSIRTSWEIYFYANWNSEVFGVDNWLLDSKIYYDLVNYMEHVITHPKTDSNLEVLAENIILAVENTVGFNGTLRNASGISICVDYVIFALSEPMNFTDQSRWDEMLYAVIVFGTPRPPLIIPGFEILIVLLAIGVISVFTFIWKTKSRKIPRLHSNI